MAGGGEDPFRTYSQPDPRFASGYYPLFPSSWTQPGAAGGSQPQPHGFSGAMNAPSHAFSGYDQNALFFASSASATAAAGGMAGPAHGYSGYGLPSGFFELAPHAGYAPLQNPQGIRHPPRHHGKVAPMHPFRRFRGLPYGGYDEGSSRYAPVDMAPVPPHMVCAAYGR